MLIFHAPSMEKKKPLISEGSSFALRQSAIPELMRSHIAGGVGNLEDFLERVSNLWSDVSILSQSQLVEGVRPLESGDSVWFCVISHNQNSVAYPAT